MPMQARWRADAGIRQWHRGAGASTDLGWHASPLLGRAACLGIQQTAPGSAPTSASAQTSASAWAVMGWPAGGLNYHMPGWAALAHRQAADPRGRAHAPVTPRFDTLCGNESCGHNAARCLALWPPCRGACRANNKYNTETSLGGPPRSPLPGSGASVLWGVPLGCLHLWEKIRAWPSVQSAAGLRGICASVSN